MPGSSSTFVQGIKSSGVLNAATIPNNAPWENLGPNGQPQGFDVDFINALGQQLGVKVQWQTTDIAGRITVLSTHKAQIVGADFTVTPERAKTVGFSDPYILVQQQFMALASAKGLNSIADLNKPSVSYCSQNGGTSDTYVPPVLPKAKKLDLPTVAACLQALNSGQVTVMTQNSFYNAQVMTQNPGKYKTIPNPSNPDTSLAWYNPSKIAFGLPKGESGWADYVNSFIQKYQSSGELGKSFKKWFGYAEPSDVIPPASK